MGPTLQAKYAPKQWNLNISPSQIANGVLNAMRS